MSAVDLAIVGCDTGGTFTDVVVVDSAGRLHVSKVPSTPRDPAEAVLTAIRALRLQPGFAVVHGTTVATNALLERRGARVGLVTTEGFRDVLAIGRQTRERLYSLEPRGTEPLVPRRLRAEVRERVDACGRVVAPLDPASVEIALDALEREGARSIAVCLLFSFLRPDHEREVGRRAAARGLPVTLSCNTAPEYREYERTATTCAAACVAPVVSAYLSRLQEGLRSLGAARFAVMQSSGGTQRADEAADHAIRTALSGPAAGLVAAAACSGQAGWGKCIAFDMGGTSTDVALVDGRPVSVRSGVVAGVPLLTPMLDIHTVGAGGGSVARVDAGGALRVGPESAGADPGPAAYGAGTRLTVTDANVLLGRLPAGTRLANSVPLDAARVRALFEDLAAEMGLAAEQAAAGVIRVVNAHMARALRHVSLERGHDPALIPLVAYGGAGPLHACALADEIGSPVVLVPRYPGAFSALGLAIAPVRREYAASHFAAAAPENGLGIEAALAPLVQRARAELRSEGVRARALHVERYLEMRYVGQTHTLRVSLGRDLATARRAFDRAHRKAYGHADVLQPVEVVAVGVAAYGPQRELPACPPPAVPGPPASSALLWLHGGPVPCAAYRRDTLSLGQEVRGPAVVLQDDATTVVEPGWVAYTDAHSNLLVTRAEDHG